MCFQNQSQLLKCKLSKSKSNYIDSSLLIMSMSVHGLPPGFNFPPTQLMNRMNQQLILMSQVSKVSVNTWMLQDGKFMKTIPTFICISAQTVNTTELLLNTSRKLDWSLCKWFLKCAEKKTAVSFWKWSVGMLQFVVNDLRMCNL